MKPRVVLLLQPRTNLLDLGGVAQVFLEAKAQGLDITVEHCAMGDPIDTSIGLSFTGVSDFRKQRLQRGDHVFVISSDIQYVLSNRFQPSKALLERLRDAHERGITICGICNGVFLLGKAGLLDGRACTTHWKRTAQLQRMNPKAQVKENILFVEDRGIISSAGATSGVDVALHVLARLKGEQFSFRISRELIVYKRRNGSEAQHSVYLASRNHMHTGIHRVQDWLQENLHRRTTLPELAERANMSYRNFCRVFRRETSLTVLEYITLLRKERINELLKQPDLSRQQIAQRCGLTSERHLSRMIAQ